MALQPGSQLILGQQQLQVISIVHPSMTVPPTLLISPPETAAAVRSSSDSTASQYGLPEMLS